MIFLYDLLKNIPKIAYYGVSILIQFFHHENWSNEDLQYILSERSPKLEYN